jgi:hypothetical protein
MKKALLTVLFVIIAASWCLAQTDSLPAPTAGSLEDTIKAAPVVVKAAKGPDKKWIIGFEATSLDFEDLPGTVSLQRKISSKLFVGAGFSYDHTRYGPDEEYDTEDSIGRFQEQKQWALNIKPEIGYMVLSGKPLAGGISIRLNLTRGRRTSVNKYWNDSYYYHHDSNSSEDNYFSYGIEVPIFIERHFKIKNIPMAIGITNNFLSLSGGWMKYKYKSSYDSYFSPTPDVNEDESTSKLPVTFSLDNPFQGKVGIVFKLYL